MLKSIFFPIPFLLLCGIATAQKQTRIDYDYANRKATFPAIIQSLPKEATYDVKIPFPLKYYSVGEIKANTIGIYWSKLDLAARRDITPGVEVNYTFVIQAKGIDHIALQAPRSIKTRLVDANNVGRDVSGLVRDYTCNFPCELVVKNRMNEVIRTIPIATESEVFTVAIHKDFLTPGAPVNPFYSELVLTDFEKGRDWSINHRIEAIVAQQVFNRALQSITFLFNNFTTDKETYAYGYIKTKGRAYDYNDLDSALAWYKTALDSMHTGNTPVCRALCVKAKEVMQHAMDSDEPRIDKNVREVLSYTLGYLNLLTQDFEGAWKSYHIAIANGFTEQVRAVYELKNRITLHETYYKLKAQLDK